jgi:tetratricopeptide (TPR) repeat protein
MVLHTGQPLYNQATAYNEATQYYISGQLDEAEKRYKKLLKIWKNHPQTHHALGTLLSQKGNQDEALKHLKTADKLTPNSPQVLSDIGIAYLRKEDYKKAAHFLEQSLKKDPKQIHSLNALGVILMRQQKFEDAIKKFERVLKTEPNHAGALENIGMSMIYAHKDLKKALIYLEKAHTHNPNNVELMGHFGAGLRDLGQYKEAQKILKKALEIEPENVKILTNLAFATYGLREIDEAHDYFLKAFEIDPSDETLLYNMLGFVEITYQDDLFENLITKARQTVPDSKILKLIEAKWAIKNKEPDKAIEILENTDLKTPNLVAHKYNMLGKLYDKKGQADKAFDAFTKAKKEQVKDITATPIDKNYYPKLIDHIKKIVTKDWLASWKHETLPPRKTPVFLIGFPRSGTTLSGQILHSHPDVHVADEVMALDKVRTALADIKEGFRYPEDLDTLTVEQIKELQDIYWQAQENDTVYENSKVFVDKFPLNSVHASLIYRLFPNAKIIFINRHPYDCTLSCFMQHFQLNTAMIQFTDPVSTATLYAKVRDNWEQQLETLPLQSYALTYEKLTADFEKEVKELLDFLELEWDDSVLTFYKDAGKKARTITPSYSQINQPIYSDATYRWERYKEHIEPMTEILQPYAKALGYKT